MTAPALPGFEQDPQLGAVVVRIGLVVHPGADLREVEAWAVGLVKPVLKDLLEGAKTDGAELDYIPRIDLEVD